MNMHVAFFKCLHRFLTTFQKLISVLHSPKKNKEKPNLLYT